MSREPASLTGNVTNDQGEPVVGATVMQYWENDKPFPGILSATTDRNGKFLIDHLFTQRQANRFGGIGFQIVHPDYAGQRITVNTLPGEISAKLKKGCTLSGRVVDQVTGKSAANALVTFKRVDEWGELTTATDDAGNFRQIVPEGRYNINAESENRVCVAVTERDCTAGESIELPQFNLINGGFISGHVVNSKTGEVIAKADDGQPIIMSLIGPSQPGGRVASPIPLAKVDDSGHFAVRAAPGDNFPYLLNMRGDRMSWDTRRQPAIVVKEGETTNYDMLITPQVSPADKLKAAQKLIADLPKEPKARTEKILAEFRKLSHTVDECDLWCSLMQELVAIGPEAVPQICDELDHTTADRSIRRLAFALRAIGDLRAVPAPCVQSRKRFAQQAATTVSS